MVGASQHPRERWWAARDIEAITVNRWAHAYVNENNSLFDEV
jgi:hypothetical protein